MKRTAQMRLIEMEHGKRLEVLLREGIEAGQNWDEIAANLGVSRGAVVNWAKELGGRIVTKRTLQFASPEALQESA